MLDAAIVAVVLDAPLVGAAVAAVVALLGGMWAITRLDNGRVIRVLTAENRVGLLEHEAACKARAAFVDVPQPVAWSQSGRIILAPGGNGGVR